MMLKATGIKEQKWDARYHDEQSSRESLKSPKGAEIKTGYDGIPRSTIMQVTADTREQIFQNQREAALRRRKQQFQSGFICHGTIHRHGERSFAPSVKNFSSHQENRNESRLADLTSYDDNISCGRRGQSKDVDYSAPMSSRRISEYNHMTQRSTYQHSPGVDSFQRQHQVSTDSPAESMHFTEEVFKMDANISLNTASRKNIKPDSIPISVASHSNQSLDEQTFVSDLSEQRQWDDGRLREKKRPGPLARSPSRLSNMVYHDRQHNRQRTSHLESALSETDSLDTACHDRIGDDIVTTVVEPQEEKPLVQVQEIEEREKGTFGESINWESMKEIKKLLMDPVPKSAGTVQCYIKRNKGKSRFLPEYRMYLKDGDRFLMTSKKRKKKKTSNYLISMARNDHNKGSEKILGKLRSNFMGTEFQIYDDGKNPKNLDPFFDEKNADPIRTELGAILYGSNIGSARGPRNMEVCINKVRPAGICTKEWQPAHKDESMIQCFKHKTESATRHLTFFQNRRPKWNEDMCAYVLNFNGRVTMASVKNFQLIDDTDVGDKNITMQFGRTGNDEFILDVKWPISVFQAFAIALSSCDSKLACD